MKSINKQKWPYFEVIVVNDDSEDNTEEVAKSFGARVVKAELLENMPPGKARACATGANEAVGEWLLFLDADVTLVSNNSLQSFLDLYGCQQRGILSLQPYHKIEKFYENLSSIFNIIVVTGMNVFSVWGDKFQTAGSFGPVILCDKTSYFTTGGHKSAEDSIMDDFALSDLFIKYDMPVKNVLSSGFFSLRMYPEGVRSLIEGWTKNLATASVSTHPFIMTLVMFWVFGGLTSATPIIMGVFTGNMLFTLLSIFVYLIYGVNVYLKARKVGDFSALLILLYPLFFCFFVGIYGYSFYRTNVLKSVNWKGRKIKF
jgi:4,4'-diaponeurosporenoate glycosyltransferase